MGVVSQRALEENKVDAYGYAIVNGAYEVTVTKGDKRGVGRGTSEEEALGVALEALTPGAKKKN